VQRIHVTQNWAVDESDIAVERAKTTFFAVSEGSSAGTSQFTSNFRPLLSFTLAIIQAPTEAPIDPVLVSSSFPPLVTFPLKMNTYPDRALVSFTFWPRRDGAYSPPSPLAGLHHTVQR